MINFLIILLEKSKIKNKGEKRKPIPQEVAEILKESLTMEYDLYDFIQQRFEQKLNLVSS